MHEVLVKRLGSLGLPRKSVIRLTDRRDMTLDVYRGRKTTMQQQQCKSMLCIVFLHHITCEKVDDVLRIISLHRLKFLNGK